MPATMTEGRRLATILLAGAVGGLAADASAANPACVAITSVPYQINAPGLYCLASDLTYAAGSGAAILVRADDVTVDFNGFSLQGTAGPGTFAMGVFADSQRGIRIEDGGVRGFLYGVLVMDDESRNWAFGGGHLVRNLRAFDNYFRGIRVEGRGVVVDHCQVANTGGTTVFGAGNYSFGIEVYGPASQLVSNVIDRTRAGDGGEAVGIAVSNSGYGTVVERNVIGNDALPASGDSFGVWVGGGSRVLLIDNRFSGLTIGAAFAFSTAGLYRDNSCAACPTLVRMCANNSSCTQSGNNPSVIDGGNNN
jgi:hypothetical protein